MIDHSKNCLLSSLDLENAAMFNTTGKPMNRTSTTEKQLIVIFDFEAKYVLDHSVIMFHINILCKNKGNNENISESSFTNYVSEIAL